MTDTILVVNAVSSSLKFQLFAVEQGAPERRLKGQLDGIGSRPRFKASDVAGATLSEERFGAGDVADLPAALDLIGRWLGDHLGGQLPAAVGHRVVHGGIRFHEPLRIDDGVLAALHGYVPLAPLHQPNNLAPIENIAARMPGTPQVACFDTALASTAPWASPHSTACPWVYVPAAWTRGWSCT